MITRPAGLVYPTDNFMVMKTIQWIFGILAIAPLILEAGYRIGPDIGMIYLLVENIIYLPLLWIGEPFFEYTADIGGYLPSISGRVLMTLVYGSIFVASILMGRFIGQGKVNKNRHGDS